MFVGIAKMYLIKYRQTFWQKDRVAEIRCSVFLYTKT